MMRSLRITKNVRSLNTIRWQRVCGILAIAVAASLLSVKLLLAVYAMAGDLDPSFGTGGKVEGVPGIGRFVIQADGKLLALSYSLNGLSVARFKLDGSLDSAFGVSGQAEANFGVGVAPAAIAIQPDGRIVVAGTTVGGPCCVQIVLARYRTNGSLDPTFSADGKVEISHVNAVGNDMALQPDGKIVVAGATIDFDPNLRHSLIVRINPEGTLDSSFATSGYLVTTIWHSQSNPAEGFSDLVIQGNGKIVVSTWDGYVYSQLVRFFANGERDLTFSSNGVLSAPHEDYRALALQPDGKIVIAVSSTNSNYGGLLMQLSADGIPDNAFGQGGKTAPDPLASWLYSGVAVGIQEDGRLVVAGGPSFRMSRYQSDGLLDASFGSNGTVTTEFSRPTSVATDMKLYGDGRIVASGVAYTPPNGTDKISVMARYLNDDGTPAPADVRVSSATISPRTVHPGDYVTYTIPVTNVGPGKAAHLTFNTQTPANTTFVSLSAPPGWVVYQKPVFGFTGGVSCSAYELPAGSTVNFSLTVRVSSSVAPGSQINQVSSIKSFMPDPILVNNTWTKTVTVQ